MKQLLVLALLLSSGMHASATTAAATTAVTAITRFNAQQKLKDALDEAFKAPLQEAINAEADVNQLIDGKHRALEYFFCCCPKKNGTYLYDNRKRFDPDIVPILLNAGAQLSNDVLQHALEFEARLKIDIPCFSLLLIEAGANLQDFEQPYCPDLLNQGIERRKIRQHNEKAKITCIVMGLSNTNNAFESLAPIISDYAGPLPFTLNPPVKYNFESMSTKVSWLKKMYAFVFGK
jgi:hypothetical protein